MNERAPVDLPAEMAPPEGGDGDALREAMRRVVAPVVVVTARPRGAEPRGATIGSFTSVALDPPLVAFNVTQGSQFHRALVAADAWAVHLLAADQADLAARFAEPDLDGPSQFAPFATWEKEGVPPLLDGALGVLLCRPHARVSAGDHTLFVGRVTRVLAGREGPPLLYYARSYRTVGEEV